MSFSYPSFLFALSAIAVPIIIHLFNFRKYKTVYFSNVQFLKDVRQETQSQSKVKHLLILACRIFAIAFIVLAFAQPFIPNNNNLIPKGKNIISIFIDNSFSMEASNESGSLLEEAKKKAIEVAASFNTTDQFQLLTNDFEGRHQRLVNKEEFEKLVGEIKISPASKSLDKIISRQADLLHQSEQVSGSSPNQNKIAFIISDFQKSDYQQGDIQIDSNLHFNLLPLQSIEKNNVFIDTCWFESPLRQANQDEKLHVRIKNQSELAINNNSIKLYINDELKTPASFSIESNSETEVIISFSITEKPSQSNNIMNCRLEIKDFPITFDDNFYFSFKLLKSIPVLCINAKNNDPRESETLYLNKLFSQDSLFLFENMEESALDFSILATKELIILNELKSISSGLALELKKFMQNGGSLLIFPNAEIDANSYKTFLQSVNGDYFMQLDTLPTKVDFINTDHEIYKEVFDQKPQNSNNLYLPIVNRHYSLSKGNNTNQERLLGLQNGDPFICKYSVGQGKLYLSTINLKDKFSNFTKHALFVPTLFNMGIYSNNPPPLFYTIGNNETIETKKVPGGEIVFHIKSLNTNFDIIPEHTIMNSKTEINARNLVKEAGNYYLFSGADLLKGLAFNYKRSESDIESLSEDQLKSQITKYKNNNINILNLQNNNIENVISGSSQTNKLWKICLILGLLFLGLEALFLRFLRG